MVVAPKEDFFLQQSDLTLVWNFCVLLDKREVERMKSSSEPPEATFIERIDAVKWRPRLNITQTSKVYFFFEAM